LRISNKVNIQPSMNTFEERHAFIKEKTCFEIIPNQEMSFDWFMVKIRLLSNFLSFGIGSPVFSLSVEGRTDQLTMKVGDVVRHIDIPIFFILQDTPQKYKHIHWSRMFFAYGHVVSDFETMIKKWFEKSELLDPVYDLYFGTLYNSSMYVQHEFLSLAQAIETYHRRVYGGKYLDAEPYEPVRQSLVEGIPGDIDSDFRESLKSKIKYGNEFSLRKRLKEILDDHSVLAESLIGNSGMFIEDVTNTRNYLTHYTEELNPKAKKGCALYVLGQKLKFLIEICLLSELGVSLETIKNRLKEDKRYAFIKPEI